MAEMIFEHEWKRDKDVGTRILRLYRGVGRGVRLILAGQYDDEKGAGSWLNVFITGDICLSCPVSFSADGDRFHFMHLHLQHLWGLGFKGTPGGLQG